MFENTCVACMVVNFFTQWSQKPSGIYENSHIAIINQILKSVKLCQTDHGFRNNCRGFRETVRGLKSILVFYESQYGGYNTAIQSHKNLCLSHKYRS